MKGDVCGGSSLRLMRVAVAVFVYSLSNTAQEPSEFIFASMPDFERASYHRDASNTRGITRTDSKTLSSATRHINWISNGTTAPLHPLFECLGPQRVRWCKKVF